MDGEGAVEDLDRGKAREDDSRVGTPACIHVDGTLVSSIWLPSYAESLEKARDSRAPAFDLSEALLPPCFL